MARGLQLEIFANQTGADATTERFWTIASGWCVTTLESLAVGVPVVTLTHPTFAGRHSASFLQALGLQGWVAVDAAGYLAAAAVLAEDHAALARWRHELRPRLAATALGDPARFAAEAEAVLLALWRGLFTPPAQADGSASAGAAASFRA